MHCCGFPLSVAFFLCVGPFALLLCAIMPCHAVLCCALLRCVVFVARFGFIFVLLWDCAPYLYFVLVAVRRCAKILWVVVCVGVDTRGCEGERLFMLECSSGFGVWLEIFYGGNET